MTVKLQRRYLKYPELSTGQVYPVVGIEADDYRIINDLGRPYLYPHRLFAVVDDEFPSDWVVETGEDGERYAYPAAMNAPGFFEDFFDGKPRANAIFWKRVNRQLTRAI
jgi:hypothetical protein